MLSVRGALAGPDHARLDRARAGGRPARRGSGQSGPLAGLGRGPERGAVTAPVTAASAGRAARLRSSRGARSPGGSPGARPSQVVALRRGVALLRAAAGTGRCWTPLPSAATGSTAPASTASSAPCSTDSPCVSVLAATGGGRVHRVRPATDRGRRGLDRLHRRRQPHHPAAEERHLDRPYLGVDPQRIEAGNSLPSGHTTVAASVAVALVFVLPPRARGFAAVVGAGYTALVGVATMSAGWHRPSDSVAALLVVGGWAAAAGLALMIAARLAPLVGLRSKPRGRPGPVALAHRPAARRGRGRRCSGRPCSR